MQLSARRQPPRKGNAGMPLGCPFKGARWPAAHQATLLPALNRQLARHCCAASTCTCLCSTWLWLGISTVPFLLGQSALPTPPLSPAGSCRACLISLCVVLQGALVQCRRALKPDGLLLAVMFGGDTLHELRVAVAAAEEAVEGGISQRVSPLAQASITSGGQYSSLLSLHKLHSEVCQACPGCRLKLAGLPLLGRCSASVFQACRKGDVLSAA